MDRILKDARRWLPGLLVSLVIIAVLIATVDWHQAYDAILTIDWRYLPLFILCYFLSIGCRAMASRVLLSGRPTFGQSFLTLNEGYLLNNVLPLRLGEIGRAFLLGRKTGLGTFHVLSAIVIERAFDLAFAAMLLIGTLPFVLGEHVTWARPAALTTLAVVLLGLLSLHLVARFRLSVRTWVDRTFGRIAFLQQHILPRMDSFLDGLEVLTSLPRFALSVLWILLVWVFGAANYYLLLQGFVSGVPLWAVLFALGVVSLGIAVPSAPASLGVFEGAMVAGLAVVGIPSGTALAYAVVLHLAHILFSGIVGGIALAREGESLSSIASSLQQLARRP